MGCTQSTSATPAGAAVGTPLFSLTKDQIEERTDCTKDTCVATFGGVSVRYAYLSQRGYYPSDENKPNQDSYSVIPDFAGSNSDAFFGVYDGHGETGDKCSQFVRDTLPLLLANGVRKVNKITEAQLNSVIQAAHKKCSKKLHSNKKVNDNWSGTTSISVYMRGDLNEIVVSNVGDSRAIIGSHSGASSALSPTALSRDQTPWRRDERERIKQKGGRILTEDMLLGRDLSKKGLEQSWRSGRGGIAGENEKVLGDEIDESGQPPRVFSPHGDYPGLTVTRTIGDKVISSEGVVDAEPEILTRELNSNDKIIFLASDGVWEFITNQQVVDICAEFSDPLEACKKIAAKSYKLWMENDTRTDDITMICIYLDE